MKSKTQKKEEALLRGQKSSALTPQERLKKLDQKLGAGIGAKKERQKLYDRNN